MLSLRQVLLKHLFWAKKYLRMESVCDRSGCGCGWMEYRRLRLRMERLRPERTTASWRRSWCVGSPLHHQMLQRLLHLGLLQMLRLLHLGLLLH